MKDLSTLTVAEVDALADALGVGPDTDEPEPVQPYDDRPHWDDPVNEYSLDEDF